MFQTELSMHGEEDTVSEKFQVTVWSRQSRDRMGRTLSRVVSSCTARSPSTVRNLSDGAEQEREAEVAKTR